jgi:hypothetical protein
VNLIGQETPLQRAFVAIRNKLQVIEACREYKPGHQSVLHGAVLQILVLLTQIEGIAHCPLDAYCPMKEFPKPKPKSKKKAKE